MSDSESSGVGFECDCGCDFVDAAPSSKEFKKDVPKEDFLCMFPSSLHMRRFVDRMQTFSTPNWPADRIVATSSEIAAAGFYYLGDKDRVKCWYCSGGLANWELDDDPWTEHAKWFPLCEFVLKHKGVDFVEKVILKNLDLKRPMIPNAAAKGVDRLLKYNLNFTVDKPLLSPAFVDPRKKFSERQEKIESALLYDKDVMLAKSMGFSETKIRWALNQQYEKCDRGFADTYELMKALRDFPPAGFLLTYPISPAQAFEVLTAERKCVICKENDRCVLFMPCGHLISCESCGRKASVCKIGIAQRIKTYKS